MPAGRDVMNQQHGKLAYFTIHLAAVLSLGLLVWMLGTFTRPGSNFPLSLTSMSALNASVSGWHPPSSTWINNLASVINGTGVHGFIFNSSDLPAGTPYGTYNWCNMPHVRASEYPRASAEYQLEYVEVIHRHHKRTPYAANTFPHESYSWSCNDSGLFYYGQPLNPAGNASALTYWDVYTSSSNPLAPSGFNGTCQFPQLTRGGLDDAWQHGRDLWGVYGELLRFLPAIPAIAGWGRKLEFRVTNNVITSQVAGMVIAGMYPSTTASRFPLKVQPASIDSLEPAYSCTAATALYADFGVGSSDPAWTAHLAASESLFNTLDAISGVASNDNSWHESWDHYFDNLSARLCHAMPLPCNASLSPSPSSSSSTTGANTNSNDTCITPSTAAHVFRLGQHEYSRLYRDDPASLAAAVGSYGIWVAELAQHLRDATAGAAGGVVYRHNVAHDGSMARLLAILQVDVMVWPGMGSEVVFEVYSSTTAAAAAAGTTQKKWHVRVLWGGRVLRSSHPDLGRIDMLDADVLLAYLDGLVGARAARVPGLCGLA